MPSLKKVVEHAEKICIANGVRLTPKRKKVLSSLLKSKRALSAYELVEVCREEFGDTMPAMTIYRILDFLESEQLAHRLNLANKYVACSHITCSHDHDAPQFLICQQCDKVQEVCMSKSTIKALKKDISGAGFKLINPQIELNCICNECSH